MDSVTVTKPEELKKALQEKREIIIVEGKLAKKVKASKKIKKLTPAALAALGTAGAVGVGGVVAAPATGGISLPVSAAVLAPVAAATGISIPVIIVILIIGLALISTLHDDYSELEISPSKIKYTRKRNDNDYS